MDEETKVAIRKLWRSQLPQDYFANAIFIAQSGMMLCKKCNTACRYNDKDYTFNCSCGGISVNDYGAPC